MASQARNNMLKAMGLGHYTTTAPQRSPKSRQQRDTVNGLMQSDRAGALELAAAYTNAAKTKVGYMRAYESLKNFYLVDGIVAAIVEDALTPDITTGEVIELTSAKASVNKALKELSKTVNFDQLVRDIAPDLVANGDYTVSVKLGDKGVEKISDNVNQRKIVAFYDGGVPESFLVEGDRELHIEKPYRYAHFVMGDFKARLNISKNFDKTPPKELPEYARIGKPLFYGTLSKIKELQLIESLVPASKLNQITRGSIVGVGVPNASDPKEAFDICRRYENVFNSSTGVDKIDGELSVSDIIGVAGKVKAVPLFGDKGSLSSIGDTKNNQSVDDLLNSITDLREIICTSIGFPPELLFGGETKAELLKRYARYLRKLKSVQTAIASGVRQIALIHLNNRKGENEIAGEQFGLDDISVRFRNELVNIDELEKLEFSDAMISTVGEAYTFINNLLEDERTSAIVNEEGVHSWLYNIFRLISTTHDLIHAPDDKDIAKRKASKPVKNKPTEDPAE